MEFEDDHYKILGLPSGEEGAKISVKDIEKAYRYQAIKCHPDKNRNDPFAKAAFQKLQSSYEILKNEITRKAFDDLLRAKIDRLHQENEFDTKRRRMMSELEKKERAKEKAREEEEMAAKKFREEVERIRAMHADKMGEPPPMNAAVGVPAVPEPMEETPNLQHPPPPPPPEESAGNSTGLYKEKILEVSWEKDGEDYSSDRLKELFGRYGGVEDIVIRRGSMRRRNALVVMVSKNAAVAASQGTWANLPNPLSVYLLHPPIVMGTQVSEQNKMLPPPMRRFQNREELLEHVRSFGKAQGYVITIKRSEKEKKVTLGCDRGGGYHKKRKIPDDQRPKKKNSRITNCPFKMEGRKMSNGSWILKIRNREHNHEPLADATEHPFNRRFSEEDVSKIKEMIAAGLQPRQMLSTLWQSNPKVSSRDVYNIKSKIRQENLSGRTPIQTLLDELSNVGFQCSLKYDEEGRLTHLFFVHPDSVTMSKSYSNVFLMDCTCKTNRYKMVLLDVIGITSFNTSFYSCFALLGKEEEEDYIWALEMFSSMLGIDCQPTVILSNKEMSLMRAINALFPGVINLFSLWHVDRSIWTNCRPHFKGGDSWDKFLATWNTLVNSTSEIAYYETWQAFQAEFREKVAALSFIATALLPFKEHFIKAWTDKHLHFGNRISSNAQGAHSKLKKYFKVSTSDIHMVKSRMRLDIENQFQKILIHLSSEKVQVPPKFCIPFFDELIGHVSVFALRQLFKQYRLATCNPTLSICTNQFSATMGLPCAHKMRYRMGESEVLHRNDIHSQWIIDGQILNSNSFGVNAELDQPNEMQMLEKTDIQHPIRPPRPKNPKPLSIIPGDPPGIEIVQRIRKCGLCKGTGHNSRTCQQKSEATRSGADFPSIVPVGGGSTLGIQNLNTFCDINGNFVCD